MYSVGCILRSYNFVQYSGTTAVPGTECNDTNTLCTAVTAVDCCNSSRPKYLELHTKPLPMTENVAIIDHWRERG